MNTQCHEIACVSQPPSVGPTIGPSWPAVDTNAIAATYCSPGTRRSTASRPIGSSIEPPMPCSARAATSWPSVCDAAQPIDASTNTRIASENTRRVPNRSASQPDAGVSIAIVSV